MNTQNGAGTTKGRARLRFPSAFSLIELDFIWITNRMTLR